MTPAGADPGFTAVKEILCELADFPHEERLEQARQRLGDRPGLLQRVLDMLEKLERSPGFLEGDLPSLVGLDAIAGPDPAGAGAAPDHAVGARIGRFELLDRLGQGGMAVVFRARQSEPVERQVALKVISAYATPLQRQRFERECTMLARFSHPNIATMYESGVSPAGEPWAAMELVRGQPISEWCRSARAGIGQRVRLLVDACRGISHAHDKGVLHRDVKPSNVMVTETDGQPVVKVIDFGIASALNPGLDHLATLTGQYLVGTPAYMSPEAVHLPDREALDARSDVYALGVLLFELLCGKRPFDLVDVPIADWMRLLSEREAPRMAQAFDQFTPEERQRIAADAGCSDASLRRHLASDLDLIVRKALAVDPDRRYASSRELAYDLLRYLDKRPVLAHAPSRAYRARRFLRRHWVGASATALLLLTLAGGFAARELEVRQTRLALAESEAVSEFLVDLLEHASPLRTESDEVMLEDIIDRGAEQLEERFVDHPAMRARMLHTLGRVYGERGDYAQGAELMQRARELSVTHGLDDGEQYLFLLSDLGVALRRQGQLDEAQRILDDAFARAEPLTDEQPLLVADLANSLGNVHVIREDFEAAEHFHALALALREANLPPGDLATTSSRNNLASALINNWRLERALPHAQQVLAEWQQSLPPHHPWISIARQNLAIILQRLGQAEEALTLLRQSLDEAEQRLGPDHPDVADYWRNLAVTQGELGLYEESRDSYRQHADILGNALGPNAPRALQAELRYISVFEEEREERENLALLDAVKARLEAGPGDTAVMVRVELARVRRLIVLGRLTEARATLEAQRQNVGLLFGTDTTMGIAAARDEATLLGAEGQHEEALAILEHLESVSLQAQTDRSLTYGLVVLELARQLIAAGQPAAAIAWTETAEQSFGSIRRRTFVVMARQLHGQACLAAGQRECATREFTAAYQDAVSLYPDDHRVVKGLQDDLEGLREPA